MLPLKSTSKFGVPGCRILQKVERNQTMEGLHKDDEAFHKTK